VQIEESESNAATGRPASICLPSSELSVNWIKARALAFAERVLALSEIH